METGYINITEGKSSNPVLEDINKAYIDLTQLGRNIHIIRSKLNRGTKFMAVVKGDAYGHGLVPIAQELVRIGCDAIGVVRLTEAVPLRRSGIKAPVIILAPLMPSQAHWAVEFDITPMVDNVHIIDTLEKNASEQNKMVNVHVKVNTGLNRYGVEVQDALGFICLIHKKYPHINIEGIYTHFRDPEFNSEFTQIQLQRFNWILNGLEKDGMRPAIAHAAGSAGIIMCPESHFDMVRCGVILYGLKHKEDETVLPEGVRPIMSLKSRILKINKIKAGESGGYGSSYKAIRDSSIAVVGIGYGDGISRGWKEVLIAGQRVPVVSYCMDCILVDITDIKDKVEEFDEVVIVGKQGNESISWEEACHKMNTYIDEQFQRITERVPKYYFHS